MKKVHVGNFGSLVFLGAGVGSWITAMFLGRIPYKLMLTGSFIGNAAGLFMFMFAPTIFGDRGDLIYYVLAFCRFFSGCNQIVMIIYMPLFVDTFSTS